MATIHLTDKNGKAWKFDESEAVYRKSVYGLAIHNDQVLLVRDPRSDKWEIPGGGVDPGESDEQALEREIKEETGLEADISDMSLISRINGFFKPVEQDFPWQTDRNYFNIQIKNPNGAILHHGNGDDVSKCEWIDIADIDNLDIGEVDLEVIKKGLNL
jgi:8-oxo-dGTP pyrophosphatase MutT (NUDIX family)